MGRRLAIVVLGAAACGGGGGAGGDGGGGGSSIGYVELTTSTSSGTRSADGNASFWQVGTGRALGDLFEQLPMGTCVAMSEETAFGLGSGVDAGASITISAAGTATLTLMPEAAFVGSYSGGGFVSSFPGNTRYDVGIPGAGSLQGATLTGALALPTAAVTTPDFSGPLTVTAGQPIDFVWTPSNATAVVINFQSHADQNQTCRVPDSGRFTVPGSVTSAVMGGGNVTFRVYTYAEKSFDSSTLMLWAQDYVESSY